MAKNKKLLSRVPQQKINKAEYDLLKPLDIYNLGSDSDPCFGKLYDLKAEECQRCGDVEFCSIAFAQHMSTERGKLTRKQAFKDDEENAYLKSEEGRAIQYMEKLLNKGKSPKLTKKLAKNKLGINADKVNKYFNKIKPS